MRHHPFFWPNFETTAAARREAHNIAVQTTIRPRQVELWLFGTFAPLWFKDAQSKALRAEDEHARDREILFAVAAAESYLFEWVRDEVLKRDFPALDQFFRPGDARGVRDKWKCVTKQLLDSKRINGRQCFSRATWNDFDELVEYRNGLLHARASRPQTGGVPVNKRSARERDKNLPVPSTDDRRNLSPGWALGIVHQLILELNLAAGTHPPDWLGD